MSALPEIAQALRSFTTSTISVVIRFCSGKLGRAGCLVISRDGGTERRLLTAERYESMNFTEVQQVLYSPSLPVFEFISSSPVLFSTPSQA